MLKKLYELYLRVMRQVGHDRWFSVFMKHVGCRIDRALLRASRGRFSMSGPALPTMLLTTRGRRSGEDRTVPYPALRARWQERRRRLRELRAKSSLQLAEEPARRPEGAHRDRRRRYNLSVAARYR